MPRMHTPFRTIKRSITLRAITLSAIILSCGLADIWMPAANAAEALPRWEAGIAAGAATLPQYMGSDERYTFAIPVPFVIYRGERLNLDRDGLRAELFGNKDVSLDASLGIGLPVRNSNRARAGMPHLHFGLQAGPRLNWRVYADERSEWTVRLPGRGVMDVKGHFLGLVSEPDLLINYQLSENVGMRLSAGALFASRKFNATYYNVDPAYVTATRPVYQSKAGLHSVSLNGAVFWKITDSVRLFSSLRYRNLNSGVISNSPLVKTPHYLSAAVGVAWSFYQSDELAGSGF